MRTVGEGALYAASGERPYATHWIAYACNVLMELHDPCAQSTPPLAA